MITLESKQSLQVTPRLLTEAFWGFSDVQQAEFFAELNDVIGESAYGHGEMQWCYLADQLDKNLKAKEQACAMMAWFFNRTTEFLSRPVP